MNGVRGSIWTSRLLSIFLMIVIAGLAVGHTSTPPSTQRPIPPTQEQMQKTHGKLFVTHTGDRISDLLAQRPGTGDLELRTYLAPPFTIMNIDPVDNLGNLACDSDLVVLGKLTNGSAHMTTDETFIYTDWTFITEEILKNDFKSLVGPGQAIVVTRPGGTLTVSNRKVHANSFRDFKPGEELLLYLRFVPDTGAYALPQPTGFVLPAPGSQVESLGHKFMGLEGYDGDKFLNTAKKGIGATQCGGGR